MLLGVNAAYEAIVWAAVVFVLVALLGLIVLLYRRRCLSKRDEHAPGFTLADIRRMRGKGQLSDQEYQSMREAVIGMDTAWRDDPGAEEERPRAPQQADR